MSRDCKELNSTEQLFKDFEDDPLGTIERVNKACGIGDFGTPGYKADQGKPRMGLVLGGFDQALLEVAKVGTFGANKYSDNGWLSVEDGERRYFDAMLRHLFDPGDVDKESGLSHAAHAAWNALAILQLKLVRERDHINSR